MSNNTSTLMSAPVDLTDCVITMLDDGSSYLTHRDTNERVCKAYSFDNAGSDWRSKTTFFTKPDEDGFWCAYDDRGVVKTLD